MIAHEIGHAVLEIDQDNKIDTSDALRGTTRAAEVIGRKYLEPKVLEAIQSQKYKNILNKIFINIQAPFPVFSRADLSEFLSADEKNVLDNFLSKMKNLGVITPYPERGRGVYHFRTLIHSLYFMMVAIPPEKNLKSKSSQRSS